MDIVKDIKEMELLISGLSYAQVSLNGAMQDLEEVWEDIASRLREAQNIIEALTARNAELERLLAEAQGAPRT